MTQSVLGTSMNRGPVSKPAAGLMHGPELPPDWKPAPKCSTNGCNEPVVYEGAPGSYKCQGCYDYMTEMYPTAAAQYTRIETAACDPIPPRPVPDPSEPMPEPAPAANLAHDLANAQMVIDFQQSEIEKLTAERNAVMAVLNPVNLPGLSLADAARWLGDDWKAEKERNDKLACQLAEWRAEVAKVNEENGKLLKRRKATLKRALKYRRDLAIVRNRRDGWKKRCEAEIKVQVALRNELEALKAQQLTPITNIVDLPLTEASPAPADVNPAAPAAELEIACVRCGRPNDGFICGKCMSEPDEEQPAVDNERVITCQEDYDAALGQQNTVENHAAELGEKAYEAITGTAVQHPGEQTAAPAESKPNTQEADSPKA